MELLLTPSPFEGADILGRDFPLDARDTPTRVGLELKVNGSLRIGSIMSTGLSTSSTLR